MQRTKVPQNDIARHALLSTAIQTAQKDFLKSRYYIMEETLTTLEQFFPQFEHKFLHISKSKAARIAATREHNEAKDHLTLCVKHGLSVIRNRVKRLNQSDSVLILYGLELSGQLPIFGAKLDVFTFAEHMIEGDKKAVEQGYAPMVCPDATEIEEALDIALEKRAQLHSADRTYDMYTEGMAELRAQADELINDVLSDLRFNLRKMDKPSARRIMRTYGVVFENKE